MGAGMDGAPLLNWTTVGSGESGGGAAPAQRTEARMCWDAQRGGLVVSAAVQDGSLCSPYTACDDETFVDADVVELFLTPTEAATDAPAVYLELDLAPTGALWAGAINDTRGNASYCTLGNDASPHHCGQFGPLAPCEGAATFAGGLTAAARNASSSGLPAEAATGGGSGGASGGWELRFFVPWASFAPQFQPQTLPDGTTAPWRSWRLNMYRTDVNAPATPPPGGGGDAGDSSSSSSSSSSCGKQTEQSSWAHVDDHFHDPPKFGYVFLV